MDKTKYGFSFPSELAIGDNFGLFSPCGRMDMDHSLFFIKKRSFIIIVVINKDVNFLNIVCKLSFLIF